MLAIKENAARCEGEPDSLMSRILVPINFSKRSADIANFAVALARHFHATVTLLHVERPIENYPFWTKETIRWAKEQMADFLPSARGDSNVRRVVGLHSDVGEGIHHVASETGTDLIVMGTHGYGAIHRALLGSVSAQVLRDAVCPVWSTPHAAPVPPAAWLHPERILCAVDPQTLGSNVVAWASQLASQLDAKLYLAWNREHWTDAPDEINRLERRYRIYGEEMIDAGYTPDTLRRTANRMQASMVVIGRNFGMLSARPGLDRYQFLRRLSCPVVSV